MKKYRTPACITREPSNPVLSHKDIPYRADLVFNAGVSKISDEYVMVFRNDSEHLGGGEYRNTSIGLARSEDGIRWTAERKPLIDQKDIAKMWPDLFPSRMPNELKRVYDPRLTVIDGETYLCMALDTAHGICGITVKTNLSDRFEVTSMSTPDNRNMVLFPEKIDGKFWRLERPFPIYGRGQPEAFDIWASASPDLRYWGDTRLVLGSEELPYVNLKIGPGAPPLRTSAGWLAAIHATEKVEHSLSAQDHDWNKIYYAGLMLLDLKNPREVIGLCREPLLVPETPYELEAGYRGSVIFPGGMILEEDGEVKIYYGAADAHVALATAHVDDLIALCEPVPSMPIPIRSKS